MCDDSPSAHCILIPAKPLYNHDIGSVHFNHFPFMTICDTKTVRLHLAVCSITCEAFPFLPHPGKLTLGLLHAASATKQR